jgi:hypothetical protein
MNYKTNLFYIIFLFLHRFESHVISILKGKEIPFEEFIKENYCDSFKNKYIHIDGKNIIL